MKRSREDIADELLVMRYEWDGCCIGGPPSAFDSFEVTLVTPMPLQRRSERPSTVRRG